MDASGTVAGVRSALVRPLNRRYPTNLAVMILVPASGLVLGGWNLGQTHSAGSALEMALRGILTTFGAWALAREVAPDDNPGAFVSLALALATILLVPDASVLPLFTAVMLIRIVNRSVGIPATPIDSTAVTLLAGWTVYRTGNFAPAVVAGIGFGLDAVLTAPLKRQWVFAAICLAGGIMVRLLAPARSWSDTSPYLPVIGVAVLYVFSFVRTRTVRSVADLTGEPLNVGRVRAGMAIAWLMGVQGLLLGGVALDQVVLIWAVLAGLLLMMVFRPAIAGIFPLLVLGALSCSGSAPPLRSPASLSGDTLIDVGGHRLHFRVWPNRSSFTLVFENGGGAALPSWESVPHHAAEQLHLQVVGYDRAGLGSSEMGPFDLMPEEEIAALGQALDHLAIGQIVLVGHSYGGLLAFLHALSRPDRVAGLVLVDPMNTDFIRRVTLTWLNTTVPDVVSPSSARDTVIVRMKRSIGNLVAATEPGIASLEMPMVVVTAGVPWWRDSVIDQAWRASHETMVAAKSNRRLLIATRSRHGIPETEPDRILEAVRLLQTLLAEDK